MNTNITRVLMTQFLTAFADNAVLFTAVTIVLQQMDKGNWYIPALQASFLIAFVLLAPMVGVFADTQPKPKVLFKANIIKALGAALIFINIEPLIAYAVIGLGAAMYSPAKYGILPEMIDEKSLVKANSWIEGSTILAILGGSLVGAAISEYSITLSMLLIIGLYIASAWIAKSIQHTYINKDINKQSTMHFYQQMRGLLVSPRARFSTLAVSLFWASATILRILLVAWAPVVLYIHSTTEIAMLTLYIAIGIAVGSLLVPKLIPIAYLRRARLAAYMMGIMIVLLATIDNVIIVRLTLFLAGVCGGLFVVPVNAALQEIGHKTIGSGGAVAIQNFFENLAMLLASGIYMLVVALQVDPVITMICLGFLMIIATAIVSWNLPRDTGILLGD